MVGSTRVNLHLAPAAVTVLDRLANERGLTRTAVVRQALGILVVMHDASTAGLLIGTTRNRESLESILIAPL